MYHIETDTKSFLGTVHFVLDESKVREYTEALITLGFDPVVTIET